MLFKNINAPLFNIPPIKPTDKKLRYYYFIITLQQKNFFNQLLVKFVNPNNVYTFQFFASLFNNIINGKTNFINEESIFPFKIEKDKKYDINCFSTILMEVSSKTKEFNKNSYINLEYIPIKYLFEYITSINFYGYKDID